MAGLGVGSGKFALLEWLHAHGHPRSAVAGVALLVDRLEVIHGVSLDVADGEFVALAAVQISVAPVLIAFFQAQRQFIRGVALTGVK